MKVLCIIVVVALARSSALTQDSALMRRVIQVEEDTMISTRPSGKPPMPKNALLIDRHGQPFETKDWIDHEKTRGQTVTTNVTRKVTVKVTTDLKNVSRSGQTYTGEHPIDWYVRRSNNTGASNSSIDTNVSDNSSIDTNVSDTAKKKSNSTASNANSNRSDTWVPMPKSGSKSDTWVPMPQSRTTGNSGVPMPAASQTSSQTNATANGTTNATANATGTTDDRSFGNTSTENASKDNGDWFKTKNNKSDEGDSGDWFNTKNNTSDKGDSGDWFKTKNHSSDDPDRFKTKDRTQNYSNGQSQNPSPQDNTSSSNSYWGNWSMPGGNWSMPGMPGGNWSMPHFDIDLGWHRRRRSSNDSSIGWPSWNLNFSDHHWSWQTSSDDSKSDGGSTVYPTPSPSPTPSPTTTMPLDRPFSVGDE